MPVARKNFTKHRPAKKKKSVRILCLLTAVFFIAGAFVIARITFSANNINSPNKSKNQLIKLAAAPEPKNIQSQTSASRIKITIGETRSVPVAGAAANSLIIVSPEIASAEIKNGNVLTITAAKIGETILIITGEGKRQTFIIEVAGKTLVSERRDLILTENAVSESHKMSGSYNALYAQGFNRNASLGRSRIELRRRLSKDRTLRASGEMYKFFGGTSRQNKFGNFQNYGLDRVSIGVDSPGETIDFLDSQVRVSPVSFDGFEMRGFHLAAKPKISKNSGSPRRGIEVFAGFARPAYALDDVDKGQKLIGAMIPIASSDSLRIRAGFIHVSAPKNSQTKLGGTVLRLDASYAPNKIFSADGETSLAGGAVSWAARLNLRLKQFGAFGEVSRFDKNSPLATLSHVSGGRKTEAFSVYWRPDKHFNLSANYNRAGIERFTNFKFADFNRAAFSVNAGYRPNEHSRLNFRFTDQQIETAVSRSPAKFQIATRTFTAGYNVRFNRNLSNDFEAGINFSREASAESRLEAGFNLRERLRFSWSGNSLTGFFNYTNRTASLTSLIMRNPQILPLELQPVFALNPVVFLQAYRDRFAFLLSGVDLPVTRSLDAGVGFQKNFSRFTVSGEARCAAGEIFGQNQKNLFTSISADFRLDAANSIQINASRSFGATGRTAIIFGFTHRFGGDGGNGFQFSKFLGFDKGKVGGRVYDDLNGNGQDDADEPGAAGLTVQLNDKRSVKTDRDGRYQFSANEGSYNIAVVSEDLGVRLRASTETVRKIFIASRQTVNVSFGVSGFGFIAGHIFNDAVSADDAGKSDFRGLAGVRLVLHSLDAQSGNFALDQTSSSGGTYEFQNIRPGNYRLEIDSATLPENFRLPAQTFREIKVAPLAGFYLDIPIAAQRAIVGIVFIDRDGDGKFNRQADETVEGASVSADAAVAVSDRNGAYILRNLRAGKIKVNVRTASGAANAPYFIELGAEPTTRRAVNFAVKR